MIDLHSHILPGIDDGAPDFATSLEMARIAVADGIEVMACTPHITPGKYNNNTRIVDKAVAVFRRGLAGAGLDLELVTGADIHVSPGIGERLVDGTWPRLARSRYFLFEPPHHVLLPRLVQLAAELIDHGLVPVVTHPERLTWIEGHYDVICELDRLGAAIQLTAGSVTGYFGKRAKYWSDRMLDEDRVDILASDAHNVSSRPPVLSRARDEASQRIGEEAARRLVDENPKRILQDQELPQRRRVDAAIEKKNQGRTSWRQRLSGLIDWGARKRA